jgi:hypothetical protein
MKRRTSNHRQPGYTLTSKISVLMSLSIFLSVASVGWETLEPVAPTASSSRSSFRRSFAEAQFQTAKILCAGSRRP